MSAREAPGILRPGLLLALLAIVGVGVLTAVHELTRDRIAAEERATMIARLSVVLESVRYDNDLLEAPLSINAPDTLGHDQTVRVYRARLGDTVTAVVLESIAPDGYNGEIRLLLGVDRTGRVTGARVVAHRETPGLGDPIEAERSDWIDAFTGRSLGDPPIDGWTVRSEGGAFDAFTGATITPRAVSRALGRSLELFEARREEWLGDEPIERP